MNKKKLLLGIVGVVVALLVITVAVVTLKLDSLVKAGVETVGPQLTRTLEGVKIGILSGSGALNGLVVGTPEGYQAEYTMKMGHASLALQPGSLLSDKLVIKSLVVEGPEIILEGGLNENNLTALQKNINDAVGATGTAPAEDEAAGAQKKLQVNLFKLTGAKVHLRLAMLGGRNVTIPAPDIEFTDLGTCPEGITAGELVKRTMNKLTTDVLAAAAKSVANLGKEVTDAASKAATDAIGGATKESTEAVGKATEGIKNLFKKQD
jgi:hypothetical protein